MKDYLAIATAIITLVSLLYRVFKIESDIYDKIDKSNKILDDRIDLIERSLALHVAIYAERKEQVDYLMHGLNEKIDHKFNRLLEEIKDIKAEIKHKYKVD